ncbi:MAG: cell division protein FtsA [Lachnospiraceae bacterium]|nr:cell division protein FtsA [Lachnospiraceae bacterium]
MITKPENEQYVFGLDIGTRSIVGTVGYRINIDKFAVVSQHVKEHETRAMLDGQIHDIKRVANTIKQVKEECEKSLGIELNQVCIAAAGRVLRTLDTHIDMVFEEERETKDEDVANHLSLGVEKAYREFNEKENSDIKFYCVGYSVVKYYLNKNPISNLVGHKAHHISADIIATFLPDDVVDGLYRSVELAGLEVANLTLEPIAAISVAIPEKYRMLNIALVDVGAGTSDISITKDGSIVAYGMIPMAGDAITDVIAKHCLVDFDMAEKIKRASDTEDTIEYEDIMGLPQTISREEVLDVIKDTIEEEARLVADEIKRLNGDKPVSAVFVVGGGGIITGYTEKLSKELNIVKERVALRGREVMGNIEFLDENAEKSSLMVTPIGICLNYFEHSNNLVYVNFNGKRMKMYDNGHVSVVDVAMQAEFPNDGLFPKRGKALTYSVNGKSKIAKGELGEAAVITVNGKPADLTALVKMNDKIVIKESTAGVRARIRVDNLPEFKEGLNLKVNGKTINLTHPVFCNGRPVTPDYEIKEDDRIEIHDACTEDQLLEMLDKVDVSDSYEELSDDDAEVSSYSDEEENTEVTEEKKPVNNVKPGGSKLTVFVNDAPVVLSGKPDYVFVDVFDFIDFDLSKPQGKSVVTIHNGKPAQYMDPLNEGDRLEISWKD